MYSNVLHDDIIDIYTITFSDSTRCNIKVTSLKDGVEITEEGLGTYSYNGNDKSLEIRAVFKNSKIPHIKNIQWLSVISLDSGSNSFNMMIKPRSTTPLMRVTFTKE